MSVEISPIISSKIYNKDTKKVLKFLKILTGIAMELPSTPRKTRRIFNFPLGT